MVALKEKVQNMGTLHKEICQEIHEDQFDREVQVTNTYFQSKMILKVLL